MAIKLTNVTLEKDYANKISKCLKDRTGRLDPAVITIQLGDYDLNVGGSAGDFVFGVCKRGHPSLIHGFGNSKHLLSGVCGSDSLSAYINFSRNSVNSITGQYLVDINKSVWSVEISE